MDTTDVVIAGAGIVGLSLALDLASHGLAVTVLDRGQAMAESSWAAAGMLAASDPENPHQLNDLAQLSLALYPNYLSEIERHSFRKVPLRTKATLQSVHFGHIANTISASELHKLEPLLQPGGLNFILLDELSLDPRDLCAALPKAAVAAGIRLIEQTPVLSIDAASTGVAVQIPTGAIAATHFVNCAGAWADSPALGRLLPSQPRIAPVKGQMTTVRLCGNAILTHVIRTPEIYLVPRGEGRITVGATVEHAGFDKTVEPHAIAALLQAAARLWHPIAEAEILESWAGLRPGFPRGSTNELPLIGQSFQPNTWIAAGHFRNGILLAPGTARTLSQLIRSETPAIDLAPFEPSRTLPAITRPLDRLVPPASDNRATTAL